MKKISEGNHEWEHLYTQFKYSSKDPVMCMVHTRTKKLVYYDVTLNRILSKQEALNYRADVTGLHVAYSASK
jgi:hypothetical protein